MSCLFVCFVFIETEERLAFHSLDQCDVEQSQGKQDAGMTPNSEEAEIHSRGDHEAMSTSGLLRRGVELST